jgi:hypothetical protein
LTAETETLFDRRLARREARHRRRLGYLYAAAGGILAIVAVIFGLSVGMSSGQEWQLSARWSARVSLHLFAVLFIIASLEGLYRQTIPSTGRFRTALRAFAGSHLIHLVAFILYFATTSEPARLITVLGGSLGYVALFVLLVCTSMTVGELLGNRRRRWLMTACLWYLWLVFAATYATRLVEGQGSLFSGYAILILLGLAAFWLFRWQRDRLVSEYSSPS